MNEEAKKEQEAPEQVQKTPEQKPEPTENAAESSAEEAQPAENADPEGLNEPFGNGKKALIVDDDPGTIELVCKILTERRFEVFQATDGKAAWDKIRPEAKPDIIVCDFLMPEMNGFELFKGLQDDEKTSDIPVVFLSARKNIEDSVMVSGADAFFSKPLQTKEFLKEIKKLILRGPKKNSTAPAEETPAEDAKEEKKD